MYRCVICTADAPHGMLCNQHRWVATLGGMVLAGRLSDFHLRNHREAMMNGPREPYARSWRKELPALLSWQGVILDDGAEMGE